MFNKLRSLFSRQPAHQPGARKAIYETDLANYVPTGLISSLGPSTSKAKGAQKSHPLDKALERMDRYVDPSWKVIYVSEIPLEPLRGDYISEHNVPIAVWLNDHPDVRCCFMWGANNQRFAGFRTAEECDAANAWYARYQRLFATDETWVYAPIPNGERTFAFIRVDNSYQTRIDAWEWIVRNCQSSVYKACDIQIDDDHGKMVLAFQDADEAVMFHLQFG